jgi:ATP-binding cassette subfamily F protein 3
MLGSFLFSNDDVDKKIKVLSGGERSRLALCEMLLQSSNLLILDEPTNHLDINSKEVLKEALKTYKGTLLIVSHDRDFLDGLTNMVLEFKDGLVKPHIGSVSEYLQYRKIESMRELEKKASTSRVAQPKQMDKKARKTLEKSIKKCSNQLSKVERKINELESSIAASDLKLSNPVESEKLMADHAFFKSYEHSKDMLDKAMEEWEVLEDELEQLMSQR